MSKGGPYFSKKDNFTESNFMEEYLKLNAYEIETLAHQPEDMIRGCQIRGHIGPKKCGELQSGKNKIFSPQTGVCYAFNMIHQDMLNKSFQIDNFGPNNGLKLKIDIEGLKFNYINHVNN